MNTKTTGLGDLVAWVYEGDWQIGVVIGHQKTDYVTYVITGMHRSGRPGRPIGIRDTDLTYIDTAENIINHLPEPPQ